LSHGRTTSRDVLLGTLEGLLLPNPLISVSAALEGDSASAEWGLNDVAKARYLDASALVKLLARPTFYPRLCLSHPTNSIGVAMMKLPRVRSEPQNKKPRWTPTTGN
jgi:hypothetical protein